MPFLEQLKRSMDRAAGYWTEDTPEKLYRSQVVAGELDRSGEFLTWHVTKYDTDFDEIRQRDLLDKAGTLHITASYLRDRLLDLRYPSTGVYPPEFGHGYDTPDQRRYLTEVNDLARAMRRLTTLPTDDIKRHILFEYAVKYSDQQGVSLTEAIAKVAEILRQTQY